MNSTEKLVILYLSNYEYILYKNGMNEVYLMLTYEKGFGVYDHTFKPVLTDISNKDLAEEEIYAYLDGYKQNEKGFINKHKAFEIEPSLSKITLEQWKKTQSK